MKSLVLADLLLNFHYMSILPIIMSPLPMCHTSCHTPCSGKHPQASQENKK